MSRHFTAHHFLEGLVDLGVDYIFANQNRQCQDGAITPDRRCGESQETMAVVMAATTILRISAPSPT
jgi:hypothetical protein